MVQIKRLNKVFVAVVCFLAFASVAQAGGRPLTAELSADNEVQTPDPTLLSDATGTANVELNQGLSRVCWRLTGSNLTSPMTAAHIHLGPAGTNGPVVIGFFGPPGTTPPPASLPAEGCVENVSGALIKRIRQNPAQFYVNVHTVLFPNGEMRGQLSK
jgi:hypothetical protein